MAEVLEPAGAETARIYFELERFELSDARRLELSGRWFGIRGRRFVRPTLTLTTGRERHRLLADLEHKPWAAEDGRLWRATFAWNLEGDRVSDVELSVAPDIVVSLPAPGPRPAGKPERRPASNRLINPRPRPRPRAPGADPRTWPRPASDSERRAQLERDAEAKAKISAALARRDAALSDVDALNSKLDSAVNERDVAIAEREEASARRDRAVSERDLAASERDRALTELDKVRREAPERPAEPTAEPLPAEPTAAEAVEIPAELVPAVAIPAEPVPVVAIPAEPVPATRRPAPSPRRQLPRRPGPVADREAEWTRRLVALIMLLAVLIALVLIIHPG